MKIKRIITGMITTAIAFSSVIAADAAESNEAVKQAQEGVYAIELIYTDASTKDEFPIQSGSAFFINSNTLLTCEHVINMDDETEDAVEALAKDFYGSYSKNNISLEVKLQSDISVGANVSFSSPEGDWAVLTISESIKNHPLSFGNSDDCQNTQSVFAIGYPSSVANYESIKGFSRDDITTTNGVISKTTETNGVKIIQHGATLSQGASGGPLVDTNGAVIGINSSGVDGEDYYFAISSEQILDMLDQKNIEYHRYSEAVIDESKESDASEEIVTTTTSSANIESKTETEDTGSNKTTILIIAISVLVICIVVILILVATGKNKSSTHLREIDRSVSPTLAVVYTITRKKNGERAAIDKINFTLGKDPSCDYCIEGNNSVSRSHAKFLVRGSDCFITDMRSTNGTYVNNKRISPNEEMKLKNGDIIRISDEEFEFRA